MPSDFTGEDLPRHGQLIPRTWEKGQRHQGPQALRTDHQQHLCFTSRSHSKKGRNNQVGSDREGASSDLPQAEACSGLRGASMTGSLPFSSKELPKVRGQAERGKVMCGLGGGMT